MILAPFVCDFYLKIQSISRQQRTKMKDNNFEYAGKSNKVESILASPILGYQSSSQRYPILTGIIQNIQSTLTQLIDSKQKAGCFQKGGCASQIEMLTKIKKDVVTVQKLLKHNIEEKSLYLYSTDKIQQKQMKNERTNNTKSPDSSRNKFRPTKEIIVSSFHSQNLKDKPRKNNDQQSNKENNFLLNNLEAACFDSNQHIQHKCNPKQDKNVLKEITPFQIPPQNTDTIKPIGQPQEQDQQFDFAFYQDNEQINGKEEDRSEDQKEQAVASKSQQNPNITFYPNQNDLKDQTNKQQKFVSDRNLFYFINHHPVLPQRLPRRKYTYLQKMKQK